MKKVDVEDALHMRVKRFGKERGLEFHPAHESVVLCGLAVLPLIWEAKESWLVVEVEGKLMQHRLEFKDE